MCWLKEIEEMERNHNRWRQKQGGREPTGTLQKIQAHFHIKSSFGEKLHLCPSYNKNLSNKSLNLLFNQLNPFPKIFPSQNTSHENSNLPLIRNYHFTPPNRQIFYCRKIVRNLRMLQSTPLIKISSSKFTYQPY